MLYGLGGRGCLLAVKLLASAPNIRGQHALPMCVFLWGRGDLIIKGVCMCRPLSKTVRFNVLRVIPAGALQKKVFAQF